MKLLYFLLGRTCIFCGRTVDPFSDGICKPCAEAIEKDRLELIDAERREIISLYRYKEPLRHGLHRFKYNGVADLGKHCAAKLAECVQRMGVEADLVTCVPRAKDGLPRIYNQSEEIARPFAMALGLPFDRTLLRKRNGARSQTECINIRSRLRNAKDAYRRAKPKNYLEGKRVILVDDLYTTGATTQTCSELLEKMGAESVIICTAMRVTDRPKTLHIAPRNTHLHYDLTLSKKKDRYIPR